MIRRSNPAVALLLASVCALFACTMVAACSAATRRDTIRDTFIALNGARDAFVAWDAGHQKVIVDQATTREQAEAQISAYRQTQAKTQEALTVAYQALTLAATQSDSPSLDTAIKISRDLISDITALIGGK